MKNKNKKLKKRQLSILLKMCLALLIVLMIALVVYIKSTEGKTMGSRITVDGLGISNLTQADAAKKIQDKFAETEVVFREGTEEIYKTTFRELGYSLDPEVLNQQLATIKGQRKKYISLFDKREDFIIEYEVISDADKYQAALTVDHFEIADGRTASTDATIAYQEDQGAFIVVKEILGDEIDEEKISNYVTEVCKTQVEQKLFSESINIELDAQVYKEAEQTANEEMDNQAAELNQYLQNYHNTSVNYLFGETTELLDTEKIVSWLVVNDDGINLDEEAVRAYISELASQYNTIYKKRSFMTSHGNEVEIKDNEFGYRIDTEAEFQQLWEDLKSGTAIEREPVYSKAGVKRNGKDDLAGSYVEVDLDGQHLWLYQDGQLITETDIVSGLPTKERETYRGAWPIAYKASPFTLNSETYGYQNDVTYWMPFVYGQGLHDAPWKSEFGGEIYKSKGSHGCINLPPDQAKLIYETIVGGYPIIIY